MLKGREQSREYWTNKFFEIHKDDIYAYIKNACDGAYCDGYNTVLQAYEELFGLDERYWKLVDYLDKVN
jgi:hypothetical protein